MKKQKNKIPADRVAIAPYNFVPLPDRVIAFNPAGDHSRYVHYTGQIVCKLTTETDLYIRSGLTASEYAASQQNAQPVDPPQRANLEELIAALQTNPKNKPQFFSTTNSNQPVIPASSLRGMIRSLVEIASFSKVGWVSDRRLIFRTIGDKSNIGTDYRERLLEDTPLKEKRYTPKTEAGYIELDENNNWCIRPARKVQGCSFTRAFSKFNIPKIPDVLEPTQFSHVCKIWYQLGNLVYRKYTKVEIKYFNVQDLSSNDKSGFEQGYIVYSGNMGNKKSEALVFPLDGNAQLIEIPHDLVQIYRDQLSKEAIALLGDQGVLQDGCPVFYLIENGKLIFFGHNQMLRLAHRSSPKESIPHEINDNSLPDLAEAIFGYVRQNADKKEQALAGRVFFSNAHLAPEQGDVLKETQIPQILASPKPTTFQHYLVQENVNKDQLDHYSSQNATIRGRKLYWHQRPLSAYMGDNPEARTKIRNAPKQYTCITPVKPATTFEFIIRFENLSDIELGHCCGCWNLRIQTMNIALNWVWASL